MNELSNYELQQVEGGGLKLSSGAAIVIGGIITFCIGVVSGFFNPVSVKK